MNFNVTLYPITWFKDRYVDESLEIKPPYQRRPVWGLRQKVKLIESILLKLPIPELFIDQTTDPDGNTTFAIVDGQQRTRAVLQFLGLDRDPLEKEYNDFTLDTLAEGSTLKNKSFKELTAEQRKDFFSYKFVVRVLDNANEIELRDTFTRINEYLTRLNAQELRNATYSGPFVRLVAACADDKFWTENAFFRTSDIRRMKDLQYASDLLIGIAFGPQSGSGRVIDDYYIHFEEFEDEIPEQADIVERFNYTLHVIRLLFPEFALAGRFRNSADFYSLFVAIAALRRDRKLIPTSGKSLARLRSELLDFGGEVNQRIADSRAKVSDQAIQYAKAIEKGVTDKSRRAARHLSLLQILEKHVVAPVEPKPSTKKSD